MAWNHVLLIHTDAKEPDVKAIVLSVFLGGLAVCVLTGASVLWALLLGLPVSPGTPCGRGTRRATLPSCCGPASAACGIS